MGVRKFTDEQELEMVRLYNEEKLSMQKIADKYTTYATSVKRILDRRSVKTRTLKEANGVVQLEDIKSKEGSRDFNYFLGLLATDGCVTGDRVVLDFSESNKELLDYWNEFLSNKCNITKSIHKIYKVTQYRIAFRNQEICDYLGSFGIVPRKTYGLTLKYIDWDVLRGIIDGDGCVLSRNNDTTVSIGITSGSKQFLEQISKFYLDNGIKSYLKESNRNLNTTYYLYVHKTEDIIKIYKNLYKNAHFYLKRKKLKFGPVLKKLSIDQLVNSGKEMCNSNPEPSLNKDGVETLHE